MPGHDRSAAVPSDPFRAALARQYRAGLAMLAEAVRRCPNEAWTRGTPDAAFWQLAYHALFYTHLYLSPGVDDFRPWPGHQGGVQNPDALGAPDDPESGRPHLPDPYAKEDVLAYAAHLETRLDEALAAIDLEAEESGFPWYPMPKLEHQLVNLRHLQHHVGQLNDRLRAEVGEGADWVGSREARP